MAVTTLDENTALVLIDLQKGVLAHPLAHPVEGVVKNAADLAAGFRAAGRPVVLVKVNFSPDFGDAVAHRSDVELDGGPPAADWAEFPDELGAAPGDLYVTKRNFGAFYGTELDLQLRRRGVTNLVLGGVATSLGVESTARAAYDIGYQLTFAADAMTDPSRQVHDHAVSAVFPVLGEVGSTAEILDQVSA